ncbi:MAG TPA: sigma-70 family RNA polymerase sigma factor [Phycisphaerae bacterium]|nr:sigma-70 family RNA polymerase sigma factor [Phycisphaerae bacterium]HRY71260.1 sigma-70 family RNA polymerase sigma factor [Phycisphaerae bacterium]HSA29660.1 sigma-70 family RNA polymerase sigma factor [Phycisphaerae bacterium]
MPREDDSAQLIGQATTGDVAALEGLLMRDHDRLARWVETQISPRHQGLLSADDVVQEAMADAFRHIRDFVPHGADPFFAWLVTLARRRLLDRIRALKAEKRGGDRARVEAASSNSVEDLLGVLAVDEHTPSRSVAKHEAAAALQVAMAGLKQDYREVLTLLYLQGRSPTDVAKRMGRTPRAVQMLRQRALEHLRVAVGRSSLFLSKKA